MIILIRTRISKFLRVQSIFLNFQSELKFVSYNQVLLSDPPLLHVFEETQFLMKTGATAN